MAINIKIYSIQRMFYNWYSCTKELMKFIKLCLVFIDDYSIDWISQEDGTILKMQFYNRDTLVAKFEALLSDSIFEARDCKASLCCLLENYFTSLPEPFYWEKISV